MESGMNQEIALNKKERKVDKGQEEEKLCPEESGSYIGAGDPELIIADEGLVLDEASDKDNPGDRQKEVEQDAEDCDYGVASDCFKGSDEREGDGEDESYKNLRVEMPNVFFEDVQDLVHASVS
jgi:hypothetical protein